MDRPPAPAEEPRSHNEAGTDGAAAAGGFDLIEVSKAFGETQALDHCSAYCARGEVHAVVGENGSGKSTLVKTMLGVIRPDTGSVRLYGRDLVFRRPSAAAAAGIAGVMQEILVVPAMSVTENVFLGQDRLWAGPVGEDRVRRAQSLLDQLSGGRIGAEQAAEELALSQQQLVVIARALIIEPKVLILDEATSALDVDDRERLFAVLKGLRDLGCIVVYVSHRMDEIKELADTATVLRNGNTVATLEASDISAEALVRLASGDVHKQASAGGRGVAGGPATAAAMRPTVGLLDDELVLEARAVTLRAAVPPADFSLRRGEIVGLAGLEGHGQEMFLLALAGMRKLVHGSVLVRDDHGKMARLANMKDARRLGVAYVPRDRKTEGLFLTLSILDNFGVGSKGAIVRRKRLDRALDRYREQLGIVCASSSAQIAHLSGGNQQKVLLARWLNTAPAVLLLNDPTRGVDVRTKRDIYDLFGRLQQDGLAIVLLSSDLEELLEVCQRVAVFYSGALARELVGAAVTRDAVAATMFGEAG